MKVGGGTQPIRTERGWLLLYHGVETGEKVGIYRTFWALLDLEDPSRVLRLEDDQPILEAKPALTQRVAHQMYLPTPVVFTTGIRSEAHTSELQSLIRISYGVFCLTKTTQLIYLHFNNSSLQPIP